MDTHGLEYAFVRSTEAAAIAAGRLVGLGDKNAVDGAAVEAMRTALRDAALAGVVVIGEGEKDEAPMLYHGEEIGSGNGPSLDVAVDPIDGTTLASRGGPGASRTWTSSSPAPPAAASSASICRWKRTCGCWRVRKGAKCPTSPSRCSTARATSR
jgi:hypothetical protein